MVLFDYISFVRDYAPLARSIVVNMDFYIDNPGFEGHGRIKSQKRYSEAWYSPEGRLVESSRFCDNGFYRLRFHYDHRQLPVFIEAFNNLTRECEAVYLLDFDHQMRISSETELRFDQAGNALNTPGRVFTSQTTYKYDRESVSKKTVDFSGEETTETLPYDPIAFSVDLDLHRKYDGAVACLTTKTLQRASGSTMLLHLIRSDIDGSIIPNLTYEYNNRGHFIKASLNRKSGIVAFNFRRVILYYDQGYGDDLQ